ncbi:hypothetical protein C8R45DRAFT_1080861 [Mycena sanguinolenta]|nr:hypothetical protein C8R45DRAFT_1080861 [Mycena sanguinolenta]
MSNTLSTPIVLGAISLIPYNRYILWSLGLASLVLYAADRQRPSNKLEPLEASIYSTGETLAKAKASCTRSYAELMDVTSQFYEAKLSVSNIKSRLLEPHSVSTWGELKEFMWNSIKIWQSIRRCGKKVKEIESSVLRIVEAERQRELSQDIQTSREIITSLTRRASAVNRRVGSSARVYESM